MDDLDEHIASVQQAARDARDPTQRQRLNAAAAIFAALSRRDDWVGQARDVMREVASIPINASSYRKDDDTYYAAVSLVTILRARRLLGME